VSGLLGAIFPVCECAIVPVIRRLIKKGLPVSCAITYMLSAPIINPIVVLSTLSAFSTNKGEKTRIDTGNRTVDLIDNPIFIVCSRLAIAYIVTVAVGFVVQKMRREWILQEHVYRGVDEGHDDVGPHSEVDETGHGDHGDHQHQDNGHGHGGGHSHDHDHDHDHSPVAAPQPDKLVLAMRTGMRDFIDVGMYFTIGVLITALFKAYVTGDIVQIFNQNEWVSTQLMMLLAFVLSLCSTSDAFIAANFPAPLSGKLAFLIFGPMMDVKLVFMYLLVFRRKFTFALAGSLFVVIGTLCYFWMAFF